MNKISMNDSIVSYIDFIAGFLHDHDKRNTYLQRKYTFIFFHAQFRANKNLINLLQNLKSSNPKISAFYYSEIEQVWAYIHLMLEILLNKKLKIMDTDELFQNIPSIQDCLANLWQDDTVKNQNYIILHESGRIYRIHQVNEKKLSEEPEVT